MNKNPLTISRIPKIWRTAYLIICLWYALNYLISAVIEWQVFRPYSTTALWNGVYMLEAVCLFIALTFVYTHWLFRFRIPVQILGHIGGLIVYFMAISYLSYYFDYYLDGFVYFDNWKEYMLDLLSWEAMRFYDQYIITVGVYYVIQYFEHLQRKDQEQTFLTIKNKEMQISLLKSQINPHFFFNTLNSISMLVGTDKEKARKVITQLSDIFRYALDSHANEKVRFVYELAFIENYIKIQQVRFEERLQFVTDIDPSCLSVEIPPMVLQPLVENAIKYGIGPKDDGGVIRLTVKSTKEGVYFEVNDNGLGLNAKKVLDGGTSSGVGLKNSDKRLTSIYGKSAGLQVNASINGYTVSFLLPPNGDIIEDVEVVGIKDSLSKTLNT